MERSSANETVGDGEGRPSPNAEVHITQEEVAQAGAGPSRPGTIQEGLGCAGTHAEGQRLLEREVVYRP